MQLATFIVSKEVDNPGTFMHEINVSDTSKRLTFCHSRNYSQHIFQKNSSDTRSLVFGANFLLSKLPANDLRYKKKSVLR